MLIVGLGLDQETNYQIIAHLENVMRLIQFYGAQMVNFNSIAFILTISVEMANNFVD